MTREPKISCPSCERPTPPTEMHEAGVCQFCHRAFAAAHKSGAMGRKRKPELEAEHVAHTPHDADTREDAAHFDYNLLDGIATGDDPDATAKASDAIARLLEWIFARRSVRGALVRVTALGAALRPDLLDDRTYESLARECGITKQALSKCALNFSRTSTPRLPVPVPLTGAFTWRKQCGEATPRVMQHHPSPHPRQGIFLTITYPFRLPSRHREAYTTDLVVYTLYAKTTQRHENRRSSGGMAHRPAHRRVFWPVMDAPRRNPRSPCQWVRHGCGDLPSSWRIPTSGNETRQTGAAIVWRTATGS